MPGERRELWEPRREPGAGDNSTPISQCAEQVASRRQVVAKRLLCKGQECDFCSALECLSFEWGTHWTNCGIRNCSTTRVTC